MSWLERIHEAYASTRRIRVLADALAPLLPEGARVLDVGCGDGRIARALLERRPDLALEGVDVLVRDASAIPVRAFDGRHLPFDDAAFDAVLFVDVLHHSEHPEQLLAEARRLARRAVVIKDHRLDGWLAGPLLHFMDRVGNERHGVALPHNYWPHARWHEAFAELGLAVESWSQRVPLYPPPLAWIFGRELHFIARLARA